MLTRYALILLSVLLCLSACQPSPAALAPVRLRAAAADLQTQNLTGNFAKHPQFASQFLSQQRDILIWLPPGYQAGQQRYPVLYMHDGNNLFDRRTSFGGSEWEVDERAQALVSQGQIEPLIIVGIYNSPERMNEYTWHPMELNGQLQGGQGPQYGRFLVQELKPFIDKTYRTRPEREHTAVMGSSLGGLISFYLGREYPQVFGKIGMMSPSIWWKDRALLQDLSSLSPELKIWLDMGTREGRQPEVMLQDAKDLALALEQQGFRHFHNLAFHIEPGADHSEKAWAARIDRPLRFFYGR